MNYGGLFESWEIAIAKWVINDYKQKYKCLRHESIDDLLQECLLCWLTLRDRYDPAREASRKTFMAGVIRKELGKVAEKLNANKRKTIYEAVSLDKPVNDQENAIVIEEQIPANKNIPPHSKEDLKIEISNVYKKLNSKQKKLCRLLGEDGLAINEACRHFNQSRSSIYREVDRIREIFEKEGLRDYLK